MGPNRLDVAHCTSLPITLVFLPQQISYLCGEPSVDVGITGQDVVKESGCDVDEILNQVWVAGFVCKRPAKNIKDVKSLAGRRVVTSFPENCGSSLTLGGRIQ